MKKSFIDYIESTFQEKIFSDNDLKILFPEKELSQIHNSLSYHLKKEHIKKYKRGLYSLWGKRVSNFLISNSLYGPSYVSLESALSFYQLIPEAVYETTAVCFQEKKKEFNTDVGIFSYSQMPLRPFFLEVVKNDQGKFLIAKPLRSLFDLIYTQRKHYKSLDDLENDLRIDLSELQKHLNDYSASEVLELGELYKKKSTIMLAETLVRNYK